MADRTPSPPPGAFDSETLESVRATRMGISLDWWSVIIAVALAVLLRANILPAIPWEAAPPAKIAAPTNSPGKGSPDKANQDKPSPDKH